MDSELFELCKSLYEIKPEWENELDWMVKTNKGLESEYIRRVFYEEDNDEDDFLFEMSEYGTDTAVPLYTSDYLLERLPQPVTLRSNVPFGWIASFVSQSHQAETPLKALLMLTLSLKEASIL